MSNFISVKQLPIIEEQLRSLGTEIDKDLAEALALVCTEDTVKQVKTVRASFNKKFQELEEQRKAAKSAVMAPYEAFELVYKECVASKYNSADSQLKSKISEVEGGLKLEKTEEVKAYFAEYTAAVGIDWLQFDDLGLNITLTASLKSLKEQAKAFVDKISEDLVAIEMHEHRDELLVLYKISRNLASAVTTVSERHKAIEDAAKRRAAREAEQQAEQENAKEASAVSPPVSLAPPVIVAAPEPERQESDPTLQLVFKVTAPRTKLRALKQFLEDGGYVYE